jgi:hypothetical protein
MLRLSEIPDKEGLERWGERTTRRNRIVLTTGETQSRLQYPRREYKGAVRLDVRTVEELEKEESPR